MVTAATMARIAATELKIREAYMRHFEVICGIDRSHDGSQERAGPQTWDSRQWCRAEFSPPV